MGRAASRGARPAEVVRAWRPDGLPGVIAMDGVVSSHAAEPRGEYMIGVIGRRPMRLQRGGTGHVLGPGSLAAAAELSQYRLPDGRLIHVELHLDGSVLMLADEFPEHGAVGPASGGFSSAVAFYLDCADVDGVWRKALAAGAAEHRPLMDTPFGERDGQIIDPFGYRWGLTQHLRDVSHDRMAQAAAQMFG